MVHEPGLTLRYVTEFRCIGGDCEDHCCHGWQVILDRQTHDDLQRVSAADQAEAARFRSCVKRRPVAAATDADFATIELDSGGCCPYLAADSGLCAIHGRHGEEYLSPVCAIYPRQLNQVGERLELSLSLSCPEAARQCLAQPMATDQVALPAELAANPKYFVTTRTAAEDPDPYRKYGDLLREVLWQFLDLAEYPLASRLYFAAWFAARITPFCHLGTTTFTAGRLADEIDVLSRPGVLEQWHRQFGEMSVSVRLPMQIILGILAGRGHRGTSLGPLLAALRTASGDVTSGGVTSGDLTTDDHAGLIENYRRRHERLQPVLGARLDAHLTNYCRNYLFRESLTAAPNLMIHLQSLLVRRAVLQFLLYSDPRCDAVAAATTGADLTALTVDVIYRFSRTIEHDPALTAAIMSSLAEQDMQSLAHLVMLLKV